MGLTTALALLAQAATPAPAQPPVPPSAASTTQTSAEAAASESPARVCSSANKDPNAKVIVICGPPPQGYRLNPDVLEARREMKSGGTPKSQEQRMQQGTNFAVGPAGCQYAGVNLLGAALTAAEMASRAAKGQEIGSMFITDPHPSEYQLYVEAKKRREAKEAAASAKAAQEKAQAEAAKTQTPAASTTQTSAPN
jgi:hypothetical protein